MVWSKLDSKTLDGSAEEIATDVFEEKKFLWIISNVNNSGRIDYQQQFGNATVETGQYYARKQAVNGVGGTGSVPRYNIDNSSSALTPHMMISNVINIGAEEKLVQSLFVNAGADGAGTAPSMSLTWGKFSEATDQIDILRVYDTQAGSYTADSNLTVFGTD
tara:strand:+ start:154 stop:639 length:486 start_codon:yes stop_codon:yes gene_type:complete